MSFSEFYQRSVTQPESFWAEQARRIDWQTPFTQTLDHSNPPFARWFCEGRTNLCHNAIDRWLEKQPEALALIAVAAVAPKLALVALGVALLALYDDFKTFKEGGAAELPWADCPQTGGSSCVFEAAQAGTPTPCCWRH